MLGSLQKNSIIINKEYIIIAFGCQSYIFNTITQNCIKNVHLGHTNDIVCSSLLETKKGNAQHIASVDSQGIISIGEFQIQKKSGKAQYKEFEVSNIRKYSLFGKNQKAFIKQAVFTSSTSILSINQSGQLRITRILSPQTEPQSHPLHPQHKFDHIFLNNECRKYTYLLGQEGKKVTILNNETQKIQNIYTHSNKITSITNIDQTLAIGDSRGKIYLLHNYLTEKNNKGKTKNLETVLEWHTGPVQALTSYGRHLYSAGQESVVVLWHTSDFSRDFLPRVGTPIKHLFVKIQTNQIVCVLSDNSIKIIDLSKDKQTFTYKTILDPKGYAAIDGPRFSIDTTSYHNGTLCLNSVPGKVQFINLHKNLENNELQIVPRNLINPINKDKIEPHRIQNFCFSPDWFYGCFCINSRTRSYLKFYKKGPIGYQLMNRVECPHLSKTKACIIVSNKIISLFVTYSEEDIILRTWSEHVQKKKSILDANQTFWKCSQQISYRGLKPTSISARGSFLMVVFQTKQIQIYELDNKGILKLVGNISSEQNLKQAKIMQAQYQKDKTNIKLITISKNNQFELWSCTGTKEETLKITISQKIVPKQQIVSYMINVGQKQTALIINHEKQSKIIIIDNKTVKFIELYDSDTVIQSCFWNNERLIIIWGNLTLEALDGKQFVLFEKQQSQSSHMQEEQSTEIKVYGETDIFKLNQRWIERQIIKTKSKMIDSTEGLFQLPNFISMWEQMSDKLLI